MFRFVERPFPGFFHLPKHPAPGFIVSIVCVLDVLVVHLLHPFSCCGIIGIEAQHLIVPPNGKISLPTLFQSLRFTQEGCHPFAVRGELRGDCFVENLRLLKIREKADGILVTGVHRRQQY